MKSIKPGRGPSFMGGAMGIIIAVFGVIWTVSALSLGGGPFALFGVVFVIAAVCIAVYNFKNATGKNRYSSFDIVDDDEEPDPLNERFGAERAEKEKNFCKNCGAPIGKDHKFCENCGEKIER